MKRLILLLTLSLLAAFSALAQPPDTLWTRHYGGTNNDYGTAVQQTLDSCFVIAGYFYSPPTNGEDDVRLIKTNQNGDTLWNRHYGGASWDGANDVKQTNDGGYIITGWWFSTPTFGLGDVYLIKTDGTGNQQWFKHYGDSNDEDGYCVVQTQDSGYIIAGWTNSFGAGMQDAYIIKTNASGDTVWTHTYGGTGDDAARWIEEVDEGGYIFAGWKAQGSSIYKDVWLVRLDAQGSIIWQKTYGGPASDLAYSVQQTTDDGFIVGGWTQSYGAGLTDYWLIKTDQNGDTTGSGWVKTYGTQYYDWGSHVYQSGDGGYVIGGCYEVQPNSNYRNIWIVKTNSNGDSLWSQYYGGNGNDDFDQVAPTSDGGMIITGWTNSFTYGAYDAYLIRLQGGLSVTLTPYNPPIVIPQTGGSFSFNYNAHNASNSPIPFDTWLVITVPGGFPFTVLGPFYNLTLPGGASLVRDRFINVPATAPAGEYSCMGVVGDYPWNIVDSDAFTFTKSGSNSDWLGSEGWFCTGNPFPGEELALSDEIHNSSFITHNLDPNPFNPSTVVRYQIPDARQVSLRVYNTAGRLIETLVDGWRETGEHQVTFDGSSLPSGIYLYRLQAGDFTGTGKMVLLK